MEKLPAKSPLLPVDTAVDSRPQRKDPMQFGLPFFAFSFTSMQMRIGDGQAGLQSKRISFDGSEFNVEEFEGQLPMAAFEQTVLESQKLFLQQTSTMFKQLSSWFPFPLLSQSDDKE